MGTRTNPQPSKLRAWRLQNGWTLGEVAGLTGQSVAFLSRLERGERRLTPAGKVRMARCVGATVAELFEVDEEMSEEGVALSA